MEVSGTDVAKFLLGVAAIISIPTVSFVYAVGEARASREQLSKSVSELNESIDKLTIEVNKLSTEVNIQKTRLDYMERTNDRPKQCNCCAW